jgi:hypothetical protein
VIIVELHAPDQFTQKLKLMGKVELFIYTSTPPSRVPPSDLNADQKWAAILLFKLRQPGLELNMAYHVELHARSPKILRWWERWAMHLTIRDKLQDIYQIIKFQRCLVILLLECRICPCLGNIFSSLKVSLILKF